MLIFEKIADYNHWLNKKGNDVISFIPTMGALHSGHLRLIDAAKQNSGQIVASIFVNPTQFNDPQDLLKYPRSLEKDIAELKKAGCNALFVPTENEIYPTENEKKSPVPLDYKGCIFEGEKRPGHFEGMTAVVHRLFMIIKPDSAYFGEKDFQQLKIVEWMIRQLNLPIQIKSVPTVREADGLAMSSRNIRLNAVERIEANVLYKALKYCRKNRGNIEISKLLAYAKQQVEKSGLFEIDYFDIVESDTLKKVVAWESGIPLRAIGAMRTSQVRLLDNIDVSL